VDDVLRFVVVALDGRAFGLPLATVERVVRMVDVTPLPGAPEVVDGVINVARRGRDRSWKFAISLLGPANGDRPASPSR